MFIELAAGDINKQLIPKVLPKDPLASPVWIGGLTPTALGHILASTIERNLSPFLFGIQRTYQLFRNHLYLDQLEAINKRLNTVCSLAALSSADLYRLQTIITLGPRQAIPIDFRYRSTHQGAEMISLKAPFINEIATHQPDPSNLAVEYRVPKHAHELSHWVHGTITDELIQRLTALSGEGQMISKILGPFLIEPASSLLQKGQKLTKCYESRLKRLQDITANPDQETPTSTKFIEKYKRIRVINLKPKTISELLISA